VDIAFIHSYKPNLHDFEYKIDVIQAGGWPGKLSNNNYQRVYQIISKENNNLFENNNLLRPGLVLLIQCLLMRPLQLHKILPNTYIH
jgi:hypothetical protein